MCSYNVNSVTSSSETITSDTEYPNHVYECLKYVPIYKKGAFSCSSIDDDDYDDVYDDEDVKRILEEHGESEPSDCENDGFSSAYKAAMAEMDLPLVEGSAVNDNYENWDEALEDVSMVYPPLGVTRVVSRSLDIHNLEYLTSELHTTGVFAGDDHCSGNKGFVENPTSQELRKCLEGALYGQDTDEFVVAQPYCVANKNLDFGKPKMSQKSMLDSRKKVENWMSKYAGEDDTTTATF